MARIKFLGLLLAMIYMLTACGGNTGGTAATSAPTSGPEATAVPAATSAPAATAEPTAGTAPTSVPAGETADLQVDKSKLAPELHLYNWTDYIAPEVLEGFEQEYGVKLIVDLYDANEDMLAKVRAGNSGYDVVVPSDYAVDIMAREKLIQPLDKSLLPNLKHIKPQHLDLYYDKGNQFSVPYFYGITGIAYNKTKFPNGVDSWTALFDTKQIEQYKGEVSMLDDERESTGAALRYLGKSVNDTSALPQVEELLKAQKPFLAAYNSSDVNRKLASGEYVIAHAWSGMALQARQGLGDEFSGNADIAFVIPKEGGVIWQDNLAILADSPNGYTAHVFINYILRPEVAAKNTEYIGYLTPNSDGEQLLSPELQELYKEGFAPNDETYQRLEWIVRNEDAAAFTNAWTAVKGE